MHQNMSVLEAEISYVIPDPDTSTSYHNLLSRDYQQKSLRRVPTSAGPQSPMRGQVGTEDGSSSRPARVTQMPPIPPPYQEILSEWPLVGHPSSTALHACSISDSSPRVNLPASSLHIRSTSQVLYAQERHLERNTGRCQSPPRTPDSSMLPASRPSRLQQSLTTYPPSPPSTPRASPQPSPRLKGRRSSLVLPNIDLGKRVSWMRRRSSSQIPLATGPKAWMFNGEPYDIGRLYGEVPELWHEHGDLLVYLFPASTGHGPSLRLSSEIIRCSALAAVASGRITTRSSDGRSFSAEDVRSGSFIHPTRSSKSEVHLHLNLTQPDWTHGEEYEATLQQLVSTRNLFAFLAGEKLVATRKSPTLFSIFVSIAERLQHHGFTNDGATTFGDLVTKRFLQYSFTDAVDKLILGEKMRCKTIYHVGFRHVVGTNARDERISCSARQRVERGRIDLDQRLFAAKRLETFEFPSLFSGFASDAKNVRRWREGFNSMRRFVLRHYKREFGSWPPNQGLTRPVIRKLYGDLCSLYDMLVGDEVDDDLRRLLQESDNSTPPVKPHMPHDMPGGWRLATTDFAEAYRSRGKNGKGQWIFLYVVLQCLPMLLDDLESDAEHFLCVGPDGESVEEIYRRSHCWRHAQVEPLRRSVVLRKNSDDQGKTFDEILGPAVIEKRRSRLWNE